MRSDIIITCAVTGSGDSQDKHPDLPITPKQIAASAIDAAKAGAAVVHCHVRDPETGIPSRRVDLFTEVVERIRDSETDVVINLTAGMGGDITFGPGETPMDLDPSTDVAGPTERLEHVEKNLPEICTLDCGSLNFGDADTVVINTPNMLRALAKRIQELGVKPEIEAFDTGNVWNARRLWEEGLIDDAPLFQLCMGIPYGAEARALHVAAMISALPEGAIWAGFGIGRMQMPMMAQIASMGGHVRVGLEDNLYLERGVFATNAQLVERARKILELMGATIMTPQEARDHLGLVKRQPNYTIT